MGLILRGEKKAYSNFEVVPVKVDYPHIITIKRVLEKVSGFNQLRKYLPDNATSVITKDYLFTLVNTWDPSFFPRVTAEVESGSMIKKPIRPLFVELAPDMVELLQKLQHFHIGVTNPRSLAGLKVGSKKRTRKEHTFEM
jgi:hypothetical protein